MRIIVIDDDIGASRAVQVLLAPIAVDIETDPIRALAVLPRYDVAIVDVGLPGLRGDTLVWTLRALHGERPRVVLISGRTQDELAMLAEKCGANATLMKPFSAAALAEIVRGWG